MGAGLSEPEFSAKLEKITKTEPEMLDHISVDLSLMQLVLSSPLNVSLIPYQPLKFISEYNKNPPKADSWEASHQLKLHRYLIKLMSTSDVVIMSVYGNSSKPDGTGHFTFLGVSRLEDGSLMTHYFDGLNEEHEECKDAAKNFANIMKAPEPCRKNVSRQIGVQCGASHY